MVHVGFVQACAGVFLAKARSIHGVSTSPRCRGPFERADFVGGPHVLGRDVVHGRVTRLEDVLCPRGVGERDAAEDDLDLLVHVLEPRRTRVVPDGLLSPTRLYSFTAHGNLLGSDLLRLYGRRTLVSMRWRTIRGRVGSSRVGV